MPYKDQVKQREFQRKWAANKSADDPQHVTRVKERIRRNREIRRMFIGDIKRDFGCFFCIEDDPDLLDFHHVDGKTKTMNVSAMVSQRYSIERIAAEIMQCLCVCKNHHAAMTALREECNTRRFEKNATRGNIEVRKRDRQLAAAKKLLFSSHPNRRFRKDPVRMIKYVLGE